MHRAQVHSKSPRQGTSDAMRRPTAGPNGIAMAPPTYGIDFLDRQQSAAEAEHGGTDVIVQRQIDDEDDEELLQGKFAASQGQWEEDEELQMKKHKVKIFQPVYYWKFRRPPSACLPPGSSTSYSGDDQSSTGSDGIPAKSCRLRVTSVAS